MITETLQLSRKQILLSSVLATIVLGTTPIQMQAEIIPMNVVQQNQAVKGQVLDNNGDPIIGATVKVEGTKNATVTDLDGNFTLNNVTGKKLQVSYIGYQNQVVDINNRSNIKITMYEDNKTLGEVVVVGYGTQKKANLTGAVSSVSVEDMAIVLLPILLPCCRVQLQVCMPSRNQVSQEPMVPTSTSVVSERSTTVTHWF